jgi:hypothetical protein
MADSKAGRGRPLRHGEAKARREITVTPTAWAGLEGLAAKGECSVSEVIERLGRGTLSFWEAPEGGDTLELSITKWGIDTGQGVDSSGQRYAVKRIKDTP